MISVPSPLQERLSKEIDRVLAKALRWELLSDKYPKQKMSFLRPAQQMKEDARAAFKTLMTSRDPYEISIAITDMEGYNSDD